MKLTLRHLFAFALFTPLPTFAWMGSSDADVSQGSGSRMGKPEATILVRPGGDTTVFNAEDEPLTLGKPISFATSLFKGRALIRLRHASASDCDPERHSQYFTPSRKTRLMQLVVQGQFQKPAKMSDIYVGSVLNKPLAKTPPALVTKALEKALRKFQPGALVDLDCKNPTFVALYAGTAQTMSIDPSDSPNIPDILDSDIMENVASHLPLYGGCPDKRQKKLAQPKHASQYEFDTEHTYTFHTFNEFFDYGTGQVKVPFLGSFDMKPTFGDQPFKLSAVSSEGEALYSFEIRHLSNELKP